MNTSGPGEEKQAIDEFLIADYQHFADSFWRNEELGEKRINFFISLLTATVAGLVVLATRESGFSDAQVQWLAFATGLALLVFGLSTLLRMLRRNDKTDEYIRAMDQVRDIFCTRYGLAGYHPFEPKDKTEKPRPRGLLTGGLAPTTALLNSMIVAGTTAIGFLSVWVGWVVAAAVMAFGSSLTLQLLLVRSRDRRSKEGPA